MLQETLGTDAEGVWAPDIEQSFQVTESEEFMPPLLTHFRKFNTKSQCCRSGSVINWPPKDLKKLPGKSIILQFLYLKCKIF